jgi:hypothetical protein
MGDLANLRNERTFPIFADCPEREVNLDFYDEIDGGFLKPKRHWCLLAEIIEINTASRATLMLKDKAGMELPMFVVIRGRHGGIWSRPENLNGDKEQLRVGYCVAILYPHRQDFLGDVVGIRCEVEGWAKVITEKFTGRRSMLISQVIPCSMVDLLALSDRVQAQNTKLHGKKACHACGKREEALMKCGRCNLCWYCDGVRRIKSSPRTCADRQQVCQRVGWNQKGHKADCKILRDRDIQAMFALDWDSYKVSLDFQMPHTVANS